jgi:hypothetical protein
MRLTGFLIVAGTFVAVTLLADAIIQATGSKARDLALVFGGIVGCQVGVIVWHKRAPGTPERSVKFGLGAALAITAVAFALIYQEISSWLAYPEVVIPIAAIGCFVLPFAVGQAMWKALSKGKPPEGNAEPNSAENLPPD